MANKNPSIPTPTPSSTDTARAFAERGPTRNLKPGSDVPLHKATSRGDSPRPEADIGFGSRGSADTVRRPRVAILIAQGVDSEAAETLYDGLVDSGAVPLYVSMQLGTITSVQGVPLEAEGTLGTSPPVLFEAVVVPGGKDHVTALCAETEALDFLKEQHRLSKPILALQEAAILVEMAGLPAPVGSAQPDPFLFVGMHATAAEALSDLVHALDLQLRV